MARREALSADELGGVVQLLLSAATAEQRTYVLTKPRQALKDSAALETDAWDPSLSALGNRVSRRLAGLLDRLARIQGVRSGKRFSRGQLR